MKKKVISALLASTMIVSLVACGSTGGDSSDANSKSSGTTASSTAGGDEARIPHRTAAPAMQQVLVTGLQQLMKQTMQYRVKMTIVRLQNLIMS